MKIFSENMKRILEQCWVLIAKSNSKYQENLIKDISNELFADNESKIEK